MRTELRGPVAALAAVGRTGRGDRCRGGAAACGGAGRARRILAGRTRTFFTLTGRTGTGCTCADHSLTDRARADFSLTGCTCADFSLTGCTCADFSLTGCTCADFSLTGCTRADHSLTDRARTTLFFASCTRARRTLIRRVRAQCHSGATAPLRARCGEPPRGARLRHMHRRLDAIEAVMIEAQQIILDALPE